jgi:hypothetical protein
MMVTDDDMTVADQPSSRPARRTRAAPFSSLPPPSAASSRPLIAPPQFPLPPIAARSWLSLFSAEAVSRLSKPEPKPDADVVDLLIMNTLDHPAGAAPVMPTAAEGADLLDSLVADHLKRATHDVDASDDETEALTGEIQSEENGGVDLLQREIEALLSGTPSASAPVEAARSEAGNETAENESAPPLNQAELDVLLAEKSEAPVEAVAPMEMPVDDDEGASKMLEAEGVLAEELAQLMAETTTPVVAAEDAAPEVVAAVEAPVPAETVAVAAELPQRPPGVPEHPIVELAEPEEVEGDFEVERPRIRIGGLLSDVALVGAQIADMPFRWIDVMDKNLLGVAAAVLLLSGIVLKLAAWWMGV